MEINLSLRESVNVLLSAAVLQRARFRSVGWFTMGIFLAFGLFLAIGSPAFAQGTVTYNYNLGDNSNPGVSDTTLQGPAVSDIALPLGPLPLGSTLESVSVNATLDTTNYGGPANLSVDVNGFLAISTYNNLWAATSYRSWANGGGFGTTAGGTVIDTKTASINPSGNSEFSAGIDLHGVTVYLANDYDTNSWSGTVSITYDVPAAFSG